MYLIVLLIVVLALLTLTSCKDKHATKPTSMKLTKKQIDNWIEKKLTSGKDSIAYIRLKTAYAGPGTVFRTFVTGLRMNGEPIPESFTELQPGDSTIVLLYDNYMVIGSSIFDFPYDKLFEKGSLKKGINEITFFPFVDTSTRYSMLNYHPKGPKDALIMKETDVLCPPCANCRPPNPPGCKDAKIDSIPTNQ